MAGFCMHRQLKGSVIATERGNLDEHGLPLYTGIRVNHTSRVCRLARRHDNRNSAETSRAPP